MFCSANLKGWPELKAQNAHDTFQFDVLSEAGLQVYKTLCCFEVFAGPRALDYEVCGPVDVQGNPPEGVLTMAHLLAQDKGRRYNVYISVYIYM